MQFFCIFFLKQFDAFEKVFSKCFNKFDVHLLIISNIRRWGQVFKAQNYVFYFESDIAKVYPFRPTCSSYDSERKKSQKVSQKDQKRK
jgi:hypothetical protein